MKKNFQISTNNGSLKVLMQNSPKLQKNPPNKNCYPYVPRKCPVYRRCFPTPGNPCHKVVQKKILKVKKKILKVKKQILKDVMKQTLNVEKPGPDPKIMSKIYCHPAICGPPGPPGVYPPKGVVYYEDSYLKTKKAPTAGKGKKF